MNFFSEMSGRGISFTDEEKEVIAEYPELIDDIRAYIDTNGFKPNLGLNLDGWLYDENNNQSGKIPLKIVGVDSYDENTDYGLYTKECEAYEYLFNKAVASSNEYGAYITTKGIIVLPNNQSLTGSNGVRHVKFRRWRIAKDSKRLIVPTNKGIFSISAFLHTHPQGIAEPSLPDDTDFARENSGQKHYVMNPFVVNEFFPNGTTKFFAGVFEKRCP